MPLHLSANSDEPRALGVIRRDVECGGIDLCDVAKRQGYRLVFTAVMDTGPQISALIIAHHILKLEVSAVVVPSFEHIEAVRRSITDLAALVTPVRIYPRGFQWPVLESEQELSR